jgi:hypothetical protein
MSADVLKGCCDPSLKNRINDMPRHLNSTNMPRRLVVWTSR